MMGPKLRHLARQVSVANAVQVVLQLDVEMHVEMLAVSRWVKVVQVFIYRTTFFFLKVDQRENASAFKSTQLQT